MIDTTETTATGRKIPEGMTPEEFDEAIGSYGDYIRAVIDNATDEDIASLQTLTQTLIVCELPLPKACEIMVEHIQTLVANRKFSQVSPDAVPMMEKNVVELVREEKEYGFEKLFNEAKVAYLQAKLYKALSDDMPPYNCNCEGCQAMRLVDQAVETGEVNEQSADFIH